MSDLFSAPVSIPGAGYGTAFNPPNVQAGVGSVTDGDGGVLLGDIPTLVGTDRSLDNNFEYEQTTMTLSVHPNLVPEGDPPWVLHITDRLELFEGGEAQLTFYTPAIRNGTPLDDMAVFISVGGTVSLEVYGNGDGELLKGSFSITILRDLDHWNSATQEIESTENLTGIVTGTFDGVLSANL